jgi:hypothetical protein
LHNGIKVHNGRQIISKTGAGKPESPEPRPILLQDHGDPVRFRNIWLRPIEPIRPSHEAYPPWRAFQPLAGAPFLAPGMIGD